MITLSLDNKFDSDKFLKNFSNLKDALTGAVLKDKLEVLYFSQLQISLATSESFIVAICDIDNFSELNENYGFDAGDKILENFVPIAKKNLRGSDIIIRYDGEEFIFILPALKKDKAKDILNKIRMGFDDFVLEYNGKMICATISFGMVEIDINNFNKLEDLSLEKTLHKINVKLLKAKNSGKNRVC